MAIGIFGGAGFIGRNILDYLDQQDHDFLSLDRTEAPGFGSRSVVIDFSDPESYRAHLPKIETAVLLVSASTPNTFANMVSGEVETNVLSYARFFDELPKSGIKRVIYLSSGGTVYGIPESGSIDESHPTRPISNYGCGKLMIETIIKTANRNANWTFAILRPSNPVGRYQKIGSQGVVAAAVDAVVNNRTLQIWGDGSVVRDYFDVREMGPIIEKLAVSTKASGEILNIGSGVGLSVNDVLMIVGNALGKNVEREYVAARPIDVPQNVLQIKALVDRVGFSPRGLDASVVQCMV